MTFITRYNGTMTSRCEWANVNQRQQKYHDQQWGVPMRGDQDLFEMLCLEGAQAGLSWDTILAKRAAYNELFYGFDIKTCANLTDEELSKILTNPKVVRNRLKVYSVRKNALAVQKIIAEHGSLRKFFWSFVGDAPFQNSWQTMSDVPTSTPESLVMSRELKKYGCSFVGETICYAYMQSTGMVNDHLTTCFRHAEVGV